MSDWKQDKGQTTLPCIYIPFNEIDEKSDFVPIRVGMSVMRWNKASFNYTLDGQGHPSLNTAGAVPEKGFFSFMNNGTDQYFSRHDEVLSPKANVGKHIVIFFKLKLGEGVAGSSPSILHFNPYAGVNGKGGWLFSANNDSKRFGHRTQPAGKVFDAGIGRNSANGIYAVDTWYQVIIDQKVVSQTKIKTSVWLANERGELENGGGKIIEYDFDDAIPDLKYDGINTIIGWEGRMPMDIKDFIAITTSDDPTLSVIPNLRAWYANPNNEYQFPDFLRAPVTKAAPRQVGHYASYWSMNGVVGDGKAISNMYNFWNQWGVQNSAFDGIHLGLGINAFQPTAGGYLIEDIRNFADWCHRNNIKLKILVNDQTYVTENELPDHFPHWKKRDEKNSVTVISRSATYWDEIDTFDVDAEVMNNAGWPRYNAVRSASGTYRWFHHVWTLVNALKDKPAFAGFTLGETSGNAIGAQDKALGNVNGLYNRCGIYGITDSNGNYLLNKSYSMRKQRVYYLKIMKMIADQLKSRPDVMRSVQINYIRGSIPGNNVATYSQATKTFTLTQNDGVPASNMFSNGDAMFLLNGSSGAIAAGMSYGTIYYVINRSDLTWQVAATPGGTPLEFNNVSSGMWLTTIDSEMEVRRDDARGSSLHNGYILTDQNRELRFMAEGMHEYGFVCSGPDIITGSLENPIFYDGPYVAGYAQYSPVEIRLDMLYGRRWFSDLGPMQACEIQSQDSSYQDKKNGILTQILPMYAPYYEGRYSLEQVHKYAVDRLQVQDIVWFLNNENPQKALPDLIRAISK